MKGLIIKDVLILRKNMKMTLLLILFFLIFAYANNNPPYIIGVGTLLFLTNSVTSMFYDEMTQWDRYALAMPISRKDIVISKYLLATILAFLAVILSSLLAYILIWLKSAMSFLELLLVAYVVFGIAIFYISFMFPFVYKFGAERSRIITVVVFALPAMVVLIALKAGVKMPSEAQLMTMLKLSPLLLMLIVGSSYFISLKIFSNKEL